MFFNWQQSARKQKQALVSIKFSGVSLHGEFKTTENISTKRITPPPQKKSREAGRRTAAQELSFFNHRRTGALRPTDFRFFSRRRDGKQKNSLSRAGRFDVLGEILGEIFRFCPKHISMVLSSSS
jgi:hypothetical protein